MATIDDVVICKIHPCIGIARVGNSPTEFFVGPEIPGVFDPPTGGYKDSGDPQAFIPPRLKRQAARFWIFGYDKDGNCLGNINCLGEQETSKPRAVHAELRANITWTVHLANKKAAYNEFRGQAGEDANHPAAPLRNKSIVGSDRQKLVIDPSPRDITGANARAQFTGGKCSDICVPLGEIRTDEQGRLLVLGGFGKSGTATPSQRISNYANNDGWFDDVSDGPVNAAVVTESGRKIEVIGSWVLVTPPDFAPSISHVTTLYDIAFQVAVRKHLLDAPSRPSFTKHIYPLLSRATALQWVNQLALTGHGADPRGGRQAGIDLMKNLAAYADNTDKSKADRTKVFQYLRDPTTAPDEKTARNQANPKYMPPLSGDSGDARTWPDDYEKDEPFKPETWLTLTAFQYELMRKWADGDFDADWTGHPGEAITMAPGAFIPGVKPHKDAVASYRFTPEGLDRAALEAAVGGAFYPGIEAGWVIRNPQNFSDKEPFRLDQQKLKAGDVSQHMACPWQADFYECNTNWWPAQRPDYVLTSESLEQIQQIDSEIDGLDKQDPNYQQNLNFLLDRRESIWLTRDSWSRGIPDNDPDNDAYSHAGDETMVNEWHHLGVVVSKLPDGSIPKIDGALQYIESERYKYLQTKAEDFYYLTNIDRYPDFLPRAHELALQYLNDAKFDADPNYAEFTYTPQAFEERLQKIYDDFVDGTMHFQLWTENGQITWPAVVDYDQDGEPVKKSRRYNVGKFSDKAVKERIFQAAPFNLIDGAWLQNILKTGPADEVHARLFSIWSDEAGNGRTELNHCNVYQTLLRSQNIYLPPVNSREFIEQDFMKSAFDGSIIQLAVGLFPEEFLPELLGMTLYLEWEATPTLTPIVKAYDGRHIDPHFYRMHVAIDNISVGHGALVKEAVQIYLQARQDEGGDLVVQEQWARIWRGYVAWATAGFAGNELLERMMLVDRKSIYIQSSLLKELDILRPLFGPLRSSGDPVSKYLNDKLSPNTKALLDAFDDSLEPAPEKPLKELRTALKQDLNLVLRAQGFWDPDRFKDVNLSPATRDLLKTNPNPTGVDLIDLNRWLLEEAFVSGIAKKEPFPNVVDYYRNKMVELIKRKAPVARNGPHSSVFLTDLTDSTISKRLDRLWDKPAELMDMLVRSGLIDIQHPRESQFFDRLTFSGPMYKVFTDEERGTILDWIEVLRDTGVQPTRPQPNPTYPKDPAKAMLQVLSERLSAGEAVQEHGSYKIKCGGTERSVLEWMKTGPMSLMEALRGDSSWIVPGNANASHFFNLVNDGPMRSAFDEIQKGIIREWIQAGAPAVVAPIAGTKGLSALMEVVLPLGEASDARAHTLSVAQTAYSESSGGLVAYERPLTFSERRRHIGMGSVH